MAKGFIVEFCSLCESGRVKGHDCRENLLIEKKHLQERLVVIVKKIASLGVENEE